MDEKDPTPAPKKVRRASDATSRKRRGWLNRPSTKFRARCPVHTVTGANGDQKVTVNARMKRRSVRVTMPDGSTAKRKQWVCPRCVRGEL